MKRAKSSPGTKIEGRSPASREIYRRLTDTPHPGFYQDGPGAAKDEIEISSDWTLKCPGDMPEMVKIAAGDLKKFLKETMKRDLSFLKKAGKFITVDIDRKDLDRREHVIEVSDNGISISASGEWGAASALYHLQRLLRLRRAPCLQTGVIHGAPALDPSLTHLAIKRSDMNDLNFPEAYNEAYLVRLARAGYTGFHLDLCINLFSKSQILPELDNPQAESNLKKLRKIVKTARKYALEVFIVLYNHPPLFSDEHPVFKKHPKMKGSTIARSGGRRVLCSGHPLTRKFYEEQAVALIRQGVAGLFLIAGCEGLLHCYTAPGARGRKNTDCPNCGTVKAHESVAELLNGITRAVKDENPEALSIVWTYGMHTWERNAARFISKLSPESAFMCNFDTNDACVREGVEAAFSDYSLTCVGPSAEFLKQIAAAQKRGMKIMGKLESGCPREIHNIPCIPANTRWGRKYENLLESGVTGAMFVWEFTGYTEEIPGELAGWMSWRPCPSAGKLLEKIAVRDFGESNSPLLMKAWRCFDKAMDYFPFSAQVIHFAQGPFFIGFTQPLIFDVHNPGRLSPQFWLNGVRQLFDMDLGWTYPFGAEKCLKTIRKMEKQWKKGCAVLDEAGRVNTGFSRHRALCRGILCILRTAINLIRFYIVRDKYLSEKSDLKLVRRRLNELSRIAEEELANAEEGLICMRENIMIGHDYVNGGEFTVEMTESKIEHTRNLIENQLPLRMFDHSFGMNSRDETLGKCKWR